MSTKSLISLLKTLEGRRGGGWFTMYSSSSKIAIGLFTPVEQEEQVLSSVKEPSSGSRSRIRVKKVHYRAEVCEKKSWICRSVTGTFYIFLNLEVKYLCKHVLNSNRFSIPKWTSESHPRLAQQRWLLAVQCTWYRYRYLLVVCGGFVVSGARERG